MDVKLELTISKAPHFKLKKWVKLLISELDEGEVQALEIDWRNNYCLREILNNHSDKASYIIEENV